MLNQSVGLNRLSNIVFVLLVSLIICIPLIKTDWRGGGISESEKRELAARPRFFIEDGINESYAADLELWINDNIGLRDELVLFNAKIQYYLFNNLSNNSDMYLGDNGELNYATANMIADYQNEDIPTIDFLNRVAEGYNIADKFFESQGISFYYFQCWDKHSIYPEHFPSTVIRREGNSRVDVIVQYLIDNTNVNIINPKEDLIQNKPIYDTYSLWGDPTHWTERGAYIGYLKLMETINSQEQCYYTILAEDDYQIDMVDAGSTLFGGVHKTCFEERFTVNQTNAILCNEKLTVGADDYRNRFYSNGAVDNNTTILFICDSYFYNYIIDDIAESFNNTICLHSSYLNDLDQIIADYEPDIVVVENAERCQYNFGSFANYMIDNID